MEEKSSQSVKLSSLKPHFLFNALNSVKCEVISDASDKVDLLDDFAAYLRYILRFSENNNVISAKEIVAFLGSYIRLEEARYDQIRIIFEVETLHFQMEALTLFELIYNAIHHGLGGNAPDGKVWVRIQKGKGEVIIEIEDNGKGISKEGDILDLATKLDRYFRSKNLWKAEGVVSVLIRRRTGEVQSIW